MSATPSIAAVLEQMSRIVAQPDTICTTENGLKALAARSTPAHGSGRLFGGLEIRTYPVGTTLTERRTGKVHTIREGWFLTCYFDDVTIREPQP
ncbi:hypothetical protein [EBPR siphovirus 2]|nr:hypothetical protein [EBPR siphovirus 2]